MELLETVAECRRRWLGYFRSTCSVIMLLLLASLLLPRGNGPIGRPSDGASVAGSGWVLAVLGGFRAPAAAISFLRAYAAWEQRDSVATLNRLDLTVRLDFRPVEYWLRGAGVIALDVPHWRFQELERDGAVLSPARKLVIRREQLEAGLAFLRRGEALLPGESRLPLERARLWLTVFQDRGRALEAVRDAVATGDRNWFAMRLYADLLESNGRTAEALAFLERLLPLLPPDDVDPSAQRAYVAERIKELRALLQRG